MYLGDEDIYAITVDGAVLDFPIIIKAVGDPNTLATGLTYPGGIIDSLNTLYQVFPMIRLEDSLDIPKSTRGEYQFVSPTPTV